MKELDLQVGDRITYKDDIVEIINHTDMVFDIKEFINNKGKDQILKIERIGENGWYTVYEKKDLLTEEEKEFLKDMYKYFNISKIEFIDGNSIKLLDQNSYVIGHINYPKNLNFKGIENDILYISEELG